MTTNEPVGNLSGTARPTAAGRALMGQKPVDPFIDMEARILLATDNLSAIVKVATENGHLAVALCIHEAQRLILDAARAVQVARESVRAQGQVKP